MMDARDVLDVLAVLAEDGIEVVLDGGWGIEALLGAQHRDHDDLDVVVSLDGLEAIVASLEVVGFRVAEDLRPTRVVLADSGQRRVDLHLVRTDESGDHWQDGGAPDGGDLAYPAARISSGWVAGQQVRCIDAQLQVDHHRGYDPLARDLHDLGLLQRQFGVSLPEGYR